MKMNKVCTRVEISDIRDATNPPDHLDSSKENYPAELQFTPDGNYLLVSNRGDENLVMFSVGDQTDQVLVVREYLESRGSFTRYFTFDPTGAFLIVANQKSNSLICYSNNRGSGTFDFISQLNDIQSPQHLLFLTS